MPICQSAVRHLYHCPSHTLPLVLLAVGFALPALIAIVVPKGNPMNAVPVRSTPLNLPSGVVVAIGCVLGVLAGFVHTFGFDAPWGTYLAVIIVFAGALGISPLVGSAFRNALHLGATASIVITAGLTALVFAIPTFGLDPTWRGVLQGIVVFAATLGFGPLPAAPATKYGLG